MNDERVLIENILALDNITEENEEIIFKIIPELICEKGFLQNNDWHIYDVWNHTKKVVQSSSSKRDLRLVLLLHDIGKPHCYTDDECGVRRFRGHAQKSSEISRPILERLGYAEKEINEMCFLIENHDKTIEIDKVNKNNVGLYKKLIYIQYCDAAGYNPKYIKGVYDRLDGIFLQLENYIESNRKDIDDVSI